jgi:hypothetical protein
MRRLVSLLALVALAGACSEESGPPPINPSSGPGGNGAGGNAGGGGDSAGGGGGHATGGHGGAGGGQAGAGGGPDLPMCAYFDWEATGKDPLIATAADDQLGSLSVDVLTIAWMTPNGDVHVAERGSPGSAFGAGATLPAAGGWYGVGRVALSPDGLRIVVISSDGERFGELTRASTADLFAGTPDEGPFAAINASVGGGESLADPIISSDDGRLYYSRHGGGVTSTIHWATHAQPDDPWALGGALSEAELQMTNGDRRIPTGIAPDGRSLFYWDESTSLLRMAIRASVAAPFTMFGDVGATFEHAVPSADCATLYYTDAASQDITYADPP